MTEKREIGRRKIGVISPMIYVRRYTKAGSWSVAVKQEKEWHIGTYRGHDDAVLVAYECALRVIHANVGRARIEDVYPRCTRLSGIRHSRFCTLFPLTRQPWTSNPQEPWEHTNTPRQSYGHPGRLKYVSKKAHEEQYRVVVSYSPWRVQRAAWIPGMPGTANADSKRTRFYPCGSGLLPDDAALIAIEAHLRILTRLSLFEPGAVWPSCTVRTRIPNALFVAAFPLPRPEGYDPNRPAGFEGSARPGPDAARLPRLA